MLHRFLAACLLALTASCTTYTPNDRLSGGVPESTVLALSPDGQQVLVAMHQARGHMKGRLIALPGKVATDVALPRGTIALVWAHAPDEVHSGPERGSKRSVYALKLDGDCTPSIVFSP